MAGRWYLRSNGTTEGPYDSVQLRQLVASGNITAETPLRQGDEGRWQRADQVQGLFQRTPASPAPKSAPVAAATPAVKPAAVRAKPAAPAPAALPKSAPAKVRVVDAAAPTAARGAVVAVAAPGQKSVGDGRHQRRRQSPLPLIAGVIVIGILLLGGGAATMIAFVMNPATTGDEVQPAISPTVVAARDVNDNEGSANAGVDEVAPGDRARTREGAVASVKSWKPAIGAQRAKGGVKSSKMQVKFDTAWLGVDANRDVGGPELVEATQRPKFLFVRLLITNLQTDQPLSYWGWNTAGPETEAILVDDAGNVAELVASAEASTDRLRDASIAAKSNVTDVLIFTLPDPNFEQLRLALPFPGMGYCGFQIEQSMLAKPGATADANELAGQPDGQDPVLGNPPAEPTPTSVENGSPTDPEKPETFAEEEPANGDAPEDLDDLRRSIAEEAGDADEPKVDASESKP